MNEICRAILALFLVVAWSGAGPVPASSQPINTCEPPGLDLVALLVGDTQIDASVENPTTSPQLGRLTLDVMLNGHPVYFEVGLTVPAGAGLDVTITFPDPTATTSFGVCRWDGDSIIDAPDPIEVNIKPRDPHDPDDEEEEEEEGPVV